MILFDTRCDRFVTEASASYCRHRTPPSVVALVPAFAPRLVPGTRLLHGKKAFFFNVEHDHAYFEYKHHANRKETEWVPF